MTTSAVQASFKPRGRRCGQRLSIADLLAEVQPTFDHVLLRVTFGREIIKPDLNNTNRDTDVEGGEHMR